MEYRDKNAQSFLAGANRFPTRNKAPPGRYPPGRFPSVSASTSIKPPNEAQNSLKDASAAKSEHNMPDPSTPDTAITKMSCVPDLGHGEVKLTVDHVNSLDFIPNSPQQPSSSEIPLQLEAEKDTQEANDQKQLTWRPVTPRAEVDEPEVESPVVPKSPKSQSAWEISIDGIDSPGVVNQVAGITGDDVTGSSKDADQPVEGADIRNEIAPKHKLENVGGIIRKDPWMNEGDDDFIFRTREFYHAFIVDWNSRIAHDVRPTFLEDGSHELHWLCDIDTETGLLRPPVEQPATFVDMNDEMKLKPSLRDHRRNWNSEYLIARENRVRGKKARRLHQARTYARCEVEVDQPQPAPPPPGKVEVDCVLRPAKPSDLRGIVDIYNWEIKRGIRAWDTELVDDEDFRRIGRTCRDAKLPFIVAVHRPVDLNDAGNWPSKEMWEEFRAWSAASQMGGLQFKKREPTVIGFGFMQPYDSGFGRGKHVGRLTMKLSVFVHHEYRRKHVGTAIIDRLLTHTSHLHCTGSMPHN
ncbi:hypothetical protein SODALDRAFT_328437 [Sodiomyces alkalinus F11]|uniref:N-acetyltransferase domain-containing protein n=1 Tax=Sodiomyces alkalinus (strain CBS 110278 / VKM F-3762 / F11) TaxID=1314773 RepID=A0A3N2PNH4_SODAK|nr:hypothetical protein SODALDRAFT_328437 [Sodiomyces alkalinus F11]ROT36052.1 hypothetical protein SODALDRAFT_328437 [Sodiomyces alkalinus F11]